MPPEPINKSWSLTIGGLQVTLEGADVLPSSDCLDFANAIKREGIEAVFENVRYSRFASTRVTVTVKLLPSN